MNIGQWFGSCRAGAFARDRRGNVAMMWGLMAAVLVGMIGLSVDFARAQTMRARLQNAADGAALVAERASTLSMTDRTAAARAFFNAEMGEFAAGATFQVTQMQTGGHRVDAGMPMPVTLARIIKNEDWSIGVIAEAQASASPPIEVALVLDNTGSMSADMNGLRDGAQSLAEFLLSIDGDTVSVALVPFVAQVNIGNGATQMAWMDTAGTNPHHGEFLEDRQIATRSASGTSNCTTLSPFVVGSPYAIRWVLVGTQCVAYNPSSINMFTLYNSLPASVRGWQGCVEARPPPYDIQDDAPNPGTPATMFVPYFWVDEGGDNTANNNWLTESSTAISGATNSSSARTLNVFKYRATATVSLAWTYPNMRGPQRGCPTPIVPLTNNRTTMINAIQGMRHWNGGGTNQAEGLVWGWRVLSPGAPFTQGRPYNDRNDPVRKVLVMMTDGENTSLNSGNTAFQSDYSSYQHRRLWTDYQDDTAPAAGSPGISAPWRRTGISGSASMVSYINNREEILCQAIKDTGIEIYTIQFRDTDAGNETRLRNCASGADHFFTAANAAALQQAFDAIGSGIGALRLTR